jgi:hypothetical protein
MTGEQLDFDGGGVSYPMPRPHRLTERQRELLRLMRAGGPRWTCEVVPFYADASGALRRLEKLGLVERVARGYWRAT